MIKRFLVSTLLLISFNESQTGWVERFAHYAARDTFTDTHNASVGKEEQTFLEKSAHNALNRGTLAVRVGYHTRGLLTQLSEHIRYSKKPTLLEKIAEELSSIPCAQTRLINNHYDFSKIKKVDEISDSVVEKFIRVNWDDLGIVIKKKEKVTHELNGIALPCIMVYTLSPSKKVYFVMDIHSEKESEDLVKNFADKKNSLMQL